MSSASHGQADRRDPAEIQRHEAHLVGQIYHLIQVNQRLEEQVQRLSLVTELAPLFREQRISRDTFELEAPTLEVSAAGEGAWQRVEALLEGLGDETPQVAELKELLGIVRATPAQVDPHWLADARMRLIAAEQAIAYLEEQTRELDLLRQEKNSIVDGVGRLEQTIEDLWKALNEKTTHIQRLERQLGRIWESVPYKLLSAVRRPLRRGDKS